jgi:hypothetical protein
MVAPMRGTTTGPKAAIGSSTDNPRTNATTIARCRNVSSAVSMDPKFAYRMPTPFLVAMTAGEDYAEFR